MASCGPTAIQIPNGYGFDATEDSYTKVAEIPQKMRWTRTFPWPSLKHGYTWRVPRKLDDPKSFTVLMPGAQGQSAIIPGTRITQQGEILVDQTTKTPTATYLTNNIQDRVSYPRFHLAQPRTPDETGYIKFRYAIQMSAETHLLFHLLPNHVPDNKHGFQFRQSMDLPQLEAAAGVPSLPYQVHNM
jgi:hypothetical protein